MEKYALSELTVTRGKHREHLEYDKAEVHIHTEDVFKSWYIDITSIKNDRFMDMMKKASDIRISLEAKTLNGHELKGEGFLHPNFSGPHASIRGSNELVGYRNITRQD